MEVQNGGNKGTPGMKKKREKEVTPS